jgi:hypothetical protein
MHRYEQCQRWGGPPPSLHAKTWRRSWAYLEPILDEIAASCRVAKDHGVVWRDADPSTVAVSEHYAEMVPAAVREHIAAAPAGGVRKHVETTLPSGRHVRLAIWGAHIHALGDIHDVLDRAAAWFHFIDGKAKAGGGSACSQTLHVHLFLTELTKILPSVGGTGVPLATQHVNSAFTFSCRKNNEMYIFRREEWWKVLMHESLHALGLDFSWTVDSLSPREVGGGGGGGGGGEAGSLVPFPGVTAWFAYEAWTEFWAEVLVLLYQIVWIPGGGGGSGARGARELLVHHGLFYESVWSRLQCTKVLRHAGITYDALRTGGGTLPESESPVFAYYVLKCLLMTRMDAFLAWCRAHDGPWGTFSKKETVQNHMAAFTEFLVAAAQDPAVVHGLTVLEQRTAGMELGDELRMSLWGGP